jgi:acetyl esterase/lipase
MIAILASLMFQHVDNDIVYATTDSKKLTLDAYRPAQPNGRVFIAIHGGEFVKGSKGGETGELCRFLSKRGFVCFDINHRLQKDVKGDMSKALSSAVTDAIEAFRWAETNCAKYGGDKYKISIGGISSGAVIAMTAAYSRGIKVRSVIDLWGGLFGEQSDIKRGAPPLLIVHGLNDKTISISMARAIENKAINVGVPVRFLLHQGGHGIDLNKTINRYTILEHIDSFLRETVK